ncbi:ASCH domain-containing protein [Lacrimispora sp. BS-2]|uniref:ASCH domain-containing protein n=1 Tax=Lacrimispora sp. BS-2 TaxID=3151850 RepID=A0AAU7PQC9_9FIRM
MNAEQMWNKFVAENQVIETEYQSWAFGAAADELAELVLRGIKTGTASAYPLYEKENESLPKKGDYSVILNSKNEAVCIIKTTKVYIVPFREVRGDHAGKEGEGDGSLEYWRKVHVEFFSKCMAEAGKLFDENMPVVCEEFELVYKP